MKRIITLIYLSMFFLNLKAQIPNIKNYLPSSNVAEMERYGENPVSFYTGTSNIGIQLGSIPNGNDNIPLSISYHAGGVLPDQHPGWVGTGWNLNVGGVITRRINGYADDFKTMPQPGPYDVKGFYYTCQLLDNESWNTKQFIENANNNIEFSNADLEPDEFYFQLPNGTSGKFYLNHKKQWVVEADKLIKVELNGDFMDIPVPMPNYFPFNLKDQPKCFGGFIVTDDVGVKYFFGVDPNTVEFSIDILNQNYDKWIATSWYLKKVIFPNNKTANFEYERGDFTAQFFHSINHIVSVKSVDGNGRFLDPNCSSTSTLQSHVINVSYPLAAIDQYIRGSLISPVYLKRINFETILVDFYSSKTDEMRYENMVVSGASYKYYQVAGRSQTKDTFAPYLSFDSPGKYYVGNRSNNSSYYSYMDNLQWRKLDSIKIADNHYLGKFKVINFKYNNIASERLKLLSVSIGRQQEGKALKYTFKYNEDIVLPKYLSAMTDHWGYYNGITLNVNSFTFYQDYHTYKVPNKTHMQAGILNKIVYPTGGMTFFEYEPHDYGMEVDDLPYNNPIESPNTVIAGGLRIKKITNYADESMSSNKVLNSKEYFYVMNYKSNMAIAQMKSSGVLGKKPRYYFTDYKLPMYQTSGKLVREIFSSQTVLTGSGNGMGGHIGYRDVIEKFLDGSYIKYQYSNITDPNFRDNAADFTMYENRSPYNPINSNEITRGKILFKNTYNVNDILVEGVSYTYKKIIYASERVRTLKANRLSIPCNGGAYALDATASGASIPYSYLPYQELHSVYDVVGKSQVESSNVNDYNTNRNLIKKTNTNSKGEEIVTTYLYPDNLAFYGTYSEWGTNSRGDMIRVFRVGKNIYSKMVDVNMVSIPIEETRNLIKADHSTKVLSGSITQYTDNNNPNNLILPKEQLKLEIKNNLLAGATTGTYNGLSYDPNYKNAITFNNYDNKGNLLELQQQSCPKTSYIYSYNLQYPIAEIKNVEYNILESILGGPSAVSTIASSNPTQAEVKAWIDQLRNSPLLKNAQITSFTYTPLIGMTSQTDAKGMTIYYEYDTFLHLKAIKDQDKNILKLTDYRYKN